MNHRFKLISAAAILAVSILGACAQVTPTSEVTLTNLPASIAGAATSNQVSIVPVVQGKGLAIQGNFIGGTGTSNVVCYWRASADGTNTSSHNIKTNTITLTAATAHHWVVNFTPDELAGYRWISLSSIYNQNASITTNRGVTAWRQQ